MKLRNANFNVSSLFDLVNFKQTNFGYINILLDLLYSDKISDPVIKDGIIRALTVKNSKGIVEIKLLNYYNNIDSQSEKELVGWSIGNLFEYLYSDIYFDQIKKIAINKHNGMSRQMFIMALGKTKNNKAEAEKTLLDLTFDNEVILQAIGSLGKLKSEFSKDRLIDLENSKNGDVKKAARKALEKFS